MGNGKFVQGEKTWRDFGGPTSGFGGSGGCGGAHKMLCINKQTGEDLGPD